MNRVEMFDSNSQYELEKMINAYIKDKKVISVSYSTTLVGYSVHHHACVCYEV